MELSSVLHMANRRFAYAIDKNTFVIRIKVKKNDLKGIILHYQDKYIRVSHIDTRSIINMDIYASDKFYDYYECIINIDLVCLRYYFELLGVDGNIYYYGNNRFFKDKINGIEFMFDLPQALREEEMFKLPLWAKNKIVYQIFPSRYATTKDIDEKIWYQAPIKYDTNLQGNIRGIINHLDHIKDLGVDIIYLTPIFKALSTHKYNISNYYLIDPDFGTIDDLKELVNKCHSMDIKVMLDGVFNHTGNDFFAFMDVIENEVNSKYNNWYYINDFPITYGNNKKPNYKTFAYYHGMPKLNHQNKEVRDYFINVAKYWVKECDIDGYRLDVADEVSHTFWQEFRKELKSIKEDLLIVGEVWHFSEDFLDGNEWDTIMNYDFYFSVRELLVNKSISVSDFYYELESLRGNSHKLLYPYLWNLLDSHDTERFYHTCGYDKKIFKLAIGLQMLLEGMPFIYYGDEYGMKGGFDPDCRRGMYWDSKYQDLEIYSWYKKLISIRKNYPNILGKTISFSSLDDKRILIIEKSDFVIIFNFSDEDYKIDRFNNMFDILNDEKIDNFIKSYNLKVLKK